MFVAGRRATSGRHKRFKNSDLLKLRCWIKWLLCCTFGSFISHLDGPLPDHQVLESVNFLSFINCHLAFISPAVQKLRFQVIPRIITALGSFPSTSS